MLKNTDICAVATACYTEHNCIVNHLHVLLSTLALQYLHTVAASDPSICLYLIPPASHLSFECYTGPH